MPNDIECFLYTERQLELIAARDGAQAFSTVFRGAKLCIIMYREAWGNTRWTRLESQVIVDRFMEEGSHFLVLVRLDDSPLPSWFPTTDLWIDLRAEPADSAAEYILARLKNGNLQNVRRPAARRPAPIARYQQLTGFSRSEWIPWKPEMCDACGELVQYRPIVRIGVPQQETWPATTERLCPKCARQRGFTPQMRNGLSDDFLYADRNPFLAFHLFGRLGAILPLLRNDAKLRTLGAEDVAGMRAGHTVLVLVYGSRFPASGLRIPIRERDLNQAAVNDDPTFAQFVGALVERELASALSETR